MNSIVKDINKDTRPLHRDHTSFDKKQIQLQKQDQFGGDILNR